MKPLTIFHVDDCIIEFNEDFDEETIFCIRDAIKGEGLE